MPAYVEEMDTASLKIINIFPHNIDQGIPSSPAQVLLIDGTTGTGDGGAGRNLCDSASYRRGFRRGL